jgi:hyaluronan synthase
MLLETSIQTLYPFIMLATVFHTLFGTSDSNNWRPVIWLVTMFGIALFKSFLAVIIGRDLWLLHFSCYGFIYFFGLVPSKIWALLTMNQTGWGTSARSSSELGRGQSFLQRSFHIGHLIIWYVAILVGFSFFIYRIFGNPLYFLIGAFALVPSVLLYWNGSISLGGFKKKVGGLFTRKKHASEMSTVFQVDEKMLPTKPSPVLKSPGNLLFTSTERSSGSTVEIRPAVSINDMTTAVEVLPKDARLQ